MTKHELNSYSEKENIMSAKEWLLRGRKADKIIDSLELSLARTHEIINFKIKYGLDIPVSLYISEKKLNDDINRHIEIRNEMLSAIHSVENDELKNILMLRYANGYKWTDVAEKSYIGLRWIHRNIHPRALAEIDKIIKKTS